uniref:U-box domain-containing protein n=1 Tax=Pyramimonas obovata TaxID=1411642 RepID=A0A7S0QMS9_9CHLO|mmetsp:Transcript_11468/g.23969  ORF Transcript_11468/g.23969 Transcript_11468/m.23969 type:complete len:875 (+) Transcript_11468:298-2922(+)
MDPSAAVTCLILAKGHAEALLHAVRGAKHKKSVWYKFCEELGESCAVIIPLLDSVLVELRNSKLSKRTRDAVEDALTALDAAVEEGTQLVLKCQDASTFRLYFRGADLREKFRSVAERIARCLRALPLAAMRSTLAIETNVQAICHKLEHARFELSEEDHALLRATHDAIGKQGDAVVSLLQQFEQRLDMKVSDMRAEMRANAGDDAVDLDAKEQKFMSQIAMLLQSDSAASIMCATSVHQEGESSSMKKKTTNNGQPPDSLLCPISLELMCDPVMDDFGHTYDRRSLNKALIYSPGISPNTKQEYPNNGQPRLRTNYTVKSMVEEYMQSVGTDPGGGSVGGSEIDVEDLAGLADITTIHDEERATQETTTDVELVGDTMKTNTFITVNNRKTKRWLIILALVVVLAVAGGVGGMMAAGGGGGGGDGGSVPTPTASIMTRSPTPRSSSVVQTDPAEVTRSPTTPAPTLIPASLEDIVVVSNIRFVGLDFNTYNGDSTFVNNFKADFKGAVASTAGVSVQRVNIADVHAGSVVVFFTVRFLPADSDQSETFMKQLANNPASIFAGSSLLQYSPIEASGYTTMAPTAAPTTAPTTTLPNVCEGKFKEGIPNVMCFENNIVNALEQSGANITVGYVGGFYATGRVPITLPFSRLGLCPVGVHWHLGTEHMSVGQFDEHGKTPGDFLASEMRPGFACHHYDASKSMFTTEYNWEHCIDMKVGYTYEVQWYHSAAGACGTPNQYQTPFYDGIFCMDGIISSNLNTFETIGVQGQVFTVVNDEQYYYPDLISGMVVDGQMGEDIARYTGSTTGTSRSNEICSQFSPITWQVDRKCHLISASSFDKMCADMKAQNDDMTDDLRPRGSRELVAHRLVANNQH